MTYYGSKDLAAAFRTVRGNTIKIAEDVPESQYGFKPSPESNSLSESLRVRVTFAVDNADAVEVSTSGAAYAARHPAGPPTAP